MYVVVSLTYILIGDYMRMVASCPSSVSQSAKAPFNAWKTVEAIEALGLFQKAFEHIHVSSAAVKNEF